MEPTKKVRNALNLFIALGLLAGAVAVQSCKDDKAPDPNPGTGGTGGSATGGSGGSATGGSGGSATGGTGGSATGGTGGGSPDAGPSATMVMVDPVITASVTWTADKTYILPRETKVAVRAPAVLTIEPGTKILGQQNSALVITRGAKIMAVGTKEKPILFTSSKTDAPKPGDWGGLILMGKAPINTEALSVPAKTEAIFEAYGMGEEDGKFGGTDPMDSSGAIKWVRLEFGGFPYLMDREWNNLTFCGVGAGTVVDYVQSHRGADDGVEFFGGTVSAKHLVLTQNEDDGLDTDNGFAGKAQFVIIQHLAPKGTDASNGYESDNHGTAASYKADPRTLPTIYNVTSIGSKEYTGGNFGALFRRGTGGKYYNHIIMNFATGVFEVRDMATLDQITAGNLFVKNSLFFNNGKDGLNWPVAMAMSDIDEKPLFIGGEMNNQELDPQLTDPLNLSAPNFKPKAGSPALTGGAAPPSDGFFDVSATFIGAVGADDWTAGWTAFPQPK
jgi:hypothetical protein